MSTDTDGSGQPWRMLWPRPLDLLLADAAFVGCGHLELTADAMGMAPIVERFLTVIRSRG